MVTGLAQVMHLGTLTIGLFHFSKNTTVGSWSGAVEVWQLTQTCHRRAHAQPRDGLGLVSRLVSAGTNTAPATACLKV